MRGTEGGLMALERSPRTLVLFAVIILIALPVLALGQAGAKGTAPPHVEVAMVQPRPEDVGSIDGIIKAFYEVISGPAGQPRQWARDRTLYIPGVRFVSIDSKDGKASATVLDHQSYVDGTNPSFTGGGFFEREIHRVTHRFGNVVHVFSTYEWGAAPDKPAGRGVNSLELFHDGSRWWIASAVWEDERPDNPIPKELLP
jgi:hypothetical protein